MTATAYTTNTIFENSQVNALCDLLFKKLIEQFPPELPEDPDNFFVYKGIVLSGAAAAIMQGATEVGINNITFETDQEDILKWLQTNIGKIFNCRVINFKNRILFYPFDKYYFEIWWCPGGCKEILSSGIYIQDDSFINPETL